MTWPDVDKLHRTAKQRLDSGRAQTPHEAVAFLETLVLQVDVGPNVDRDPAAQAALLTAVNAGARAFLGGVAVRIQDNPVLTDGWGAGVTLVDSIREHGGAVVRVLDEEHDTIVIGTPEQPACGDRVLYTTWNGWAGGVVEDVDARLGGKGIALAGVIAGAIAVSEAFQHRQGSPVAGRREIGVSLWSPDRQWNDPAAAGPALRYLPKSAWLLGLGHLGQGYAWSLGLLPYATPSDVGLHLMDTDAIEEANVATGLLTRPDHVGQQKTRVVAARLESIGLRAAIVERLFDDTLRPARDEPVIAFAGFDDPAPRRLLGGRFARVVDAGLGAGPADYLDILIHTFPSNLDPSTAFDIDAGADRPLPGAYAAEIDRLIRVGVAEGDARCGITQVAGVSVGASFVGAVAGALVVADLLRFLHDGRSYSVIALDLRNPARLEAVPNSLPESNQNPGFTVAL